MNFKKVIANILIIFTAIFQFTVVRADIYSDNEIPDNVKDKIEKIVNEPSHLAGIDNFKRKSKEDRIKDNICWYKKHNQINKSYNKYDLDIENYRNQDDFLSFREVNRLAIHHGNVNPRKYINLVQNKLIFEKIVSKRYPKSIPKTYFKFRGEKTIPTENALVIGFNSTKSAFDVLKNGKYFIKPITGTCGEDAILLTKKNGKLNFRHVTKGKISLKEFWNITSKTNFMVQEHIENHKDIKKLSPYALSTIRIVTTRFHDDVHILSADMRVSCQKNAVVDNFHKRGAIVHVNTETGKLERYAHRRLERSLKVHPISKIKFEGYQLPYWKQTLEIVKKLHKLFPQFSSLGWDIAITPKGPKVIETNYHWDICVPQTTIGGIKEIWEQLKNT